MNSKPQAFQDEPAARPRVAVVLPALNEEQALPLVLAELPRSCVDLIVVADNGSSDATAAVARKGGAHVVHEPRRGYGRACLSGLELVFGERKPAPDETSFEPFGDGDWVVFLDADHADYPQDLPEVIAPLAAGQAEMVIGSRLLGGATKRALLPQAWFGNKLACSLMRWMFGAHYTDLGPFRAIRVDALRHLRMRDEDYGWTVEMQLKAKVAGLRCVEVPVRYRERIGTSKVTGTWRGTIGAAYKILGWIFVWRVRLWLNPRCIPKYPRCARNESTGSPSGNRKLPDAATHRRA
jgi:glycosyltransferase involved in cell wall biosynthesis